MYNIVRLEVTNSRNDDVDISWFFGRDEEDVERWIKEKKKEEDKWNYHTQGAVSHRYYSFEKYSYDTILTADVSQLEGMKVRDLIKVINYANKNS